MTHFLDLLSFPSTFSPYVITSIFMTLNAIYILMLLIYLSPVLCLIALYIQLPLDISTWMSKGPKPSYCLSPQSHLLL